MMQRVLSVQTSRSDNNESSEFVSKRLCCSFLLTVAFFTVIGGFFLGRYASDRSIFVRHRHEMDHILDKILLLQSNVASTFQKLYKNCSCSGVDVLASKCINQSVVNEVLVYRKINRTLDLLLNCFND